MGVLDGVYAPAVDNDEVYLTSSGHSNTLGGKWTLAQVRCWRARRLATSGPAIWLQSSLISRFTRWQATTEESPPTNEREPSPWSQPLNQYDGWTPAVDAKYAYAYGELPTEVERVRSHHRCRC